MGDKSLFLRFFFVSVLYERTFKNLIIERNDQDWIMIINILSFALWLIRFPSCNVKIWTPSCVWSYRRRIRAVLRHCTGSLHLQQPLWRVHKAHQAGRTGPLPACILSWTVVNPLSIRTVRSASRARWLSDQLAVTLIRVVWGHPSWRNCLVSLKGDPSLEERLQIRRHRVIFFGIRVMVALVIWF